MSYSVVSRSVDAEFDFELACNSAADLIHS